LIAPLIALARQGTLFVAFLPLLAVTVSADDWPALSPAELAMNAPRIEPEADAEALLWDVRVAHEIEKGWVRTEFSHYIRIKVFSEGGRDRLGTVDIPYTTNLSVSDIAGRTIRPNGTILELKKDSVYDRTLVKTGGFKVNAKSFALPGLEVGSIIEYRWRETLDDRITNYFPLQFQRDIPIHVVRYHIKPINDPSFSYGMRNWSVHLKSGAFTREKDGFFMTSADSVPAFRQEPDMPAEAAVRPWMLIYYSPDTNEPPARYWQSLGKTTYQSYRDSIKLSDEMRSSAAEVVKDAGGDEGRLRKLFDYVTSGFRNTRYESDSSGRDGRLQVKENRNTLDTWKQKAGNGYDITLLFIALSEALGYEARLARGSLRDFGPFDENFTDPYFLRTYSVAVKLGGAWKFFDPASPLLPFGMLQWNEQGQAALISDPKEAQLAMTPIAPPEASLASRKGIFRLTGDGTLEGDVRVAYTGQSAYDRKARYRRQSPAEREESVRESVTTRFAAAVVAGIKVEGVSGGEPLAVAYHVRIPGYAQRTERRLFLQCAYFSRNYAPRYSASERRHPVAYPNAWSEKDRVTYQLPAGYVLEKPETPGGLRIPNLGEYDARLGVSADGRGLIYERNFDFGRGGHLLFPANAYPTLKQVFDKVQELDNHTIALRQEAN
jgi:hypothetical protein